MQLAVMSKDQYNNWISIIKLKILQIILQDFLH